MQQGRVFLAAERSVLRGAPFQAFAAYAPSLRSVRYSTTRHCAPLRTLTAATYQETPDEKSRRQVPR